ncbi:hypothetical protein PIB30_047051 [Stylosanthes scabra]|uniref:Uncharacterized protein n=1 Tax=Stylosanthes scabra TaxID=79078 RepID=A0ABU6TGC9_9FABA|nr:hypothetical protein [Stylosanthes scabra]
MLEQAPWTLAVLDGVTHTDPDEAIKNINDSTTSTNSCERSPTNNDTKDTIVAKGKSVMLMVTTTVIVEDGVTKMKSGSSAGVVDGRATWMNREALFRRVILLTARPPPLLAAMFPWDHEEARTCVPWADDVGETVLVSRGGVQKKERQLYYVFSARNVTTRVSLGLVELTPL